MLLKKENLSSGTGVSSASTAEKTVILIGKPNVGKSSLFNILARKRQKVSNYPGTTVEIKRAISENIEYVDLPGMYSFCPLVKDEQIAVDNFLEIMKREKSNDIFMVLVESTRFQEGLYLALQIRKLCDKYGKQMILVLTMMDELKNNNDQIDTAGLSEALKCRVIGVSARHQKNIDLLRNAIDEMPAEHADSYTDTTKNTNIRQTIAELAKKYGPKSDLFIKKQSKFDYIILNRFYGSIIFFVVVLFLFQSIYTWATPLIDLTDTTISIIGEYFASFFQNDIIRSFVQDGIIGGLGSFLVFVPQIFIMFFIIGLLEESGYLARAAVICHKPLKLFGLSGKSFFPMLSGYACAIPAIMATRTIESPRARYLTMTMLPLLTCSARLPVYALLISAVIPSHNYLGGLFGLQGIVFFVLYVSGLFIGLVVTGVTSKLKPATPDQEKPFILELPPYRLPSLKLVMKSTLSSTRHFITKAGSIIFIMTLIIWIAAYFPNHGDLETSFVGIAGQYIEPIMKPIGLDWKYGTAILMSFVAREVFVGTLGTLFGIANTDNDVFGGLGDSIASSGMTVAAGLGLLAFYTVALQCTSTLGILKKESGSWKLPITLLIGYTLLAYFLAFVTYRAVGYFTVG